MNAGRAFLAGVIGAVVMSLIMTGLRWLGVPLQIELRLAAMLGAGSLVLGLILHLLIGGLVGLVYALVFEYAFEQSGVGPGVIVGAINAMLAGFLWAAFDGPGRFWTSFGPVGAIAILLVHMTYGATVGTLYKAQHHYVYPD